MMEIAIRTRDEASYEMWKKALQKGEVTIFDRKWVFKSLSFRIMFDVTAELISTEGDIQIEC